MISAAWLAGRVALADDLKREPDARREEGCVREGAERLGHPAQRRWFEGDGEDETDHRARGELHDAQAEGVEGAEPLQREDVAGPEDRAAEDEQVTDVHVEAVPHAQQVQAAQSQDHAEPGPAARPLPEEQPAGHGDKDHVQAGDEAGVPSRRRLQAGLLAAASRRSAPPRRQGPAAAPGANGPHAPYGSGARTDRTPRRRRAAPALRERAVRR